MTTPHTNTHTGTSTSSTHRTASVVLLLTILGVSTACSSGSAAQPAQTTSSGAPAPTTTTLTYGLAEADGEFEMFDVGEKGDSVGDRNVSAATLEQDGEVAGRLQSVCTTLDTAYEGHVCTMAAIIDGGSLTMTSGGVRKAVPNVDGRGDVFAITGGTGDHLGASGEMTVSGDGQKVTFTLRD